MTFLALLSWMNTITRSYKIFITVVLDCSFNLSQGCCRRRFRINQACLSLIVTIANTARTITLPTWTACNKYAKTIAFIHLIWGSQQSSGQHANISNIASNKTKMSNLHKQFQPITITRKILRIIKSDPHRRIYIIPVL